MTSRRGIASIKILVALPTMIAFTWLGIEFGLVLRALQQSKIAADAGALAAAARLPEDFDVFRASAMMATQSNAGTNGGLVIQVPGDIPGIDLLTGTWDVANQTFNPDPDARESVKVTVRVGSGAPNEAPGFFLPNLLELADITFTRSAVATWNPRPASSSLLLVESTEKHALSLDDSALQDSVGEVAVSSSSMKAVQINAMAILRTPALRVTGDLDASDAGQVDGEEVETGVDPLPDPLTDIPFPLDQGIGTPPPDLSPGETFDLEPGRHPEGLTFDTGTLRFLPGVHQFGGTGLELSGDAVVVLSDATIQLLDSSTLRMLGSSRIMGPPSPGGDWADACLIAAGDSSLVMADQAAFLCPGFIYGPDMLVRMSDDSAMVIDGAISRRWIQRDNSNARFDRVILTSTEIDGGRASLRR